MPRAKANLWVARVAIALAIAAVAVSLWRWWRKGQLPSDFSRGGVELTYDVDAARAVDERFQRQLGEVVEKLRAGGAQLGAIRPQARAAQIALAGVDEAKLKQALAGTQLDGKLEGATA